jgi:hypothetical protein
MSEPVAEIRYSGEIHVRPYRRGTYLGDEHLEALIERTLGERYRYGEGWSGSAEVTIVLHDRAPVRAAPSPADTPSSA